MTPETKNTLVPLSDVTAIFAATRPERWTHDSEGYAVRNLEYTQWQYTVHRMSQRLSAVLPDFEPLSYLEDCGIPPAELASMTTTYDDLR